MCGCGNFSDGDGTFNDFIKEKFAGSEENDLKKANATAKSAYAIVMEYLVDMETIGKPIGKEGIELYFPSAHSEDGLAYPDGNASAEGDSYILRELPKQTPDKATVYVGVQNDTVFVQVKMGDTIGQYPDPLSPETQENAKWTEFLTTETSSYPEADISSLNSTAKALYNTAVELLADNECIGKSNSQTFEEGCFAQANSPEGLAVGLDKSYENEGDKQLNSAASVDTDADITVYAGLADINGEESLFVQVRDNSSGNIGQYPFPSDDGSNIVWTKFSMNAPEAVHLEDDELMQAAKVGYNAAMCYLTEMEDEGQSFQQTIANGGFAQASTDGGFTVSMTASPQSEGDRYLNEDMCYQYEGAVVYVGISDGGEIFTQVKNVDGGSVGQYPPPEKGGAEWGVSPF